jgi:hypothetical protein
MRILSLTSFEKMKVKYATQLLSASVSAALNTYTGCLIKNASTHNFFIYYPISMNKKTADMVFHALRSSHKIIFFGVTFSSLR